VVPAEAVEEPQVQVALQQQIKDSLVDGHGISKAQILWQLAVVVVQVVPVQMEVTQAMCKVVQVVQEEVRI
jgi:hypothetical protein